MSDAEAGAAGPSRGDLRRAQVLEAAAVCFNREGFHGASMASIAAEASMSVGQIYRYFANKEAVISGLVEQSLTEWPARIAAAKAVSGDVVDQLIEVARYHVEKIGQSERAALSLEFLAEAARNPRIAEIVREIDAAMRGHLMAMLAGAGMPDDADTDARLTIILMLIEGWPLRAVKDPTLGAEEFLASLRPLFAMLLAQQS